VSETSKKGPFPIRICVR